jgi:hypothetical protein
MRVEQSNRQGRSLYQTMETRALLLQADIIADFEIRASQSPEREWKQQVDGVDAWTTKTGLDVELIARSYLLALDRVLTFAERRDI